MFERCTVLAILLAAACNTKATPQRHSANDTAPPLIHVERQSPQAVITPDDFGEDTPCSPGKNFFAALRTRVRQRIKLPAGLELSLQRRTSTYVTVEIDLKPTGQLLDARVARTSGRLDLDAAVLTALRAAACMPPPPSWLIDPQRSVVRLTERYDVRQAGGVTPAAVVRPSDGLR